MCFFWFVERKLCVRILKFRSLRLPISPNLLVPIFPYSSLSFAASRDSSQFLAMKTTNLTNLQDPPSFNHFVILMSFLLSLSSSSGERGDNKTEDDDIGTSRQSQRHRDVTK